MGNKQAGTVLVLFTANATTQVTFLQTTSLSKFTNLTWNLDYILKISQGSPNKQTDNRDQIVLIAVHARQQRRSETALGDSWR